MTEPMRVLLVNPPLTDVGGPYPAICYLVGFLETIGVRAEQADASLGVIRRMLSGEGIQRLADRLNGTPNPSATVQAFLARADWYARTVDTAIHCLQGDNHGAVARASQPGFYPPVIDVRSHWAWLAFCNQRAHETRLGALTEAQRERLVEGDQLAFAFGSLGQSDLALFQSSRLLTDLSEVIREGIDPAFRLHSYESRLVRDLNAFAPLQDRLDGPPTLVDEAIDAEVDRIWASYTPHVVGLSVPFAGTVYGAFRVAKRFRALNPDVVVLMGGGWVNTALRHLDDPDVFDLVDYVTLDDGEQPLACLLEFLEGRRPFEALKRTFARPGQAVVFVDGAPEADVPFALVGTPTYRSLPLRYYLRSSMTLGQRSQHWRGRWNKLTMAHGCYWKKCAFCDVSLDYIGRYEPATVDILMSRIRQLIAETGETGFHFVDEAMPPALLRRLSERLIEERLSIAWWGNVRFDAALEAMAPLLASAGCVALTGGLEAASDRLLSLMEKGVSLAQVARVTHALSRAGLAVHAYLIYGFPTQTVQETVDALEFVRQLFENGCLHTAMWHRFSLTAHSPVARDPQRFGIRILDRPGQSFANYVLDYEEPGGEDHDRFGPALARAVARLAISPGDPRRAHDWFPFDVPATRLPEDFVRSLLPRSDILS